MLKAIIAFIRRVTVARPKVVKAFGGEVIFKNLPKDKQDLLAQYVETIANAPEQIKVTLTPEDTAQVIEAQQTPVNTKIEMLTTLANTAVVASELNDVAVGIHKDNSGSYSLVEVKYSLDSKQAVVDKVKSYGKEREVVMSDFRIVAARKFMV